MKKNIIIALVGFLIQITIYIQDVKAQKTPQMFTLKTGWNAVFLEVAPVWKDEATRIAALQADPDAQPTDPDIVFAGVSNLQSVWRWNYNNSTIEFIQDPSTLVGPQPDMLSYIPGNPAISNLHAITGNTAYLIQLGGSVPVDWIVSGEPVVPDIEWKPNSFNFVGFHLSEGQEPMYSDFFSSSPAHADQEMYVLRNDSWERVQASDGMQQGEAFWVYCKGSSGFTGPVSVQTGLIGGLSYGTTIDEFELIIKNETESPKAVQLSSSNAQFPLYYWNFDPVNDIARWENAFPLIIPLGVDGYNQGESQRIRLGVKRAILAEGELRETNLIINDQGGYGMNIRIPASVSGISHAGLWSGYAVINKVEEAQKNGDPVPTGSEFNMRLLIHVDESSNARLLQQVIQMWQKGQLIDDPNNFGMKIVDPDNPGHFVLLTDDSLTPYFSGAALLDGRPVGRRISSTSFGNFYVPDTRPANDLEPYTAFDQTSYKTISGGAFQPGSNLNVTLWLPRDDPSNPFVHKYHPDHLPPVQIEDPDVQDAFKWSHKEEKMFDITRNISFDISDVDVDQNPIFGADIISWGSSKLGGIYREIISGLHRDSIAINGTFTLRKISDVSTLTTTPPP